MSFIKKHLKFLALILTILSIYIIYQNNYNKALNYTSIGDGLSKGIDSYGNVDYGYSDYIKDYLQENNLLKFYTKDFSSEEMSITTLENIIQLDKKMVYKNTKINIKSILSESDILTMSIGLNDLIYKMSILDTTSIYKIDQIVDSIYNDFSSLITEIKKYYKEDIYVIGYYTSPKYSYMINYGIEQLNKKYQKDENIIYIATDYFLNKNEKYLLNPNQYYPNSSGYQVISSKILAKITKKLEN